MSKILFNNLWCVFIVIIAFNFSHEYVFDQAYGKYKCCHL